MQVVLVGPSWPFRGGVARVTTGLAQALAQRGALAGFCVPHRQYPRWLYPGGEDRDEGSCPKLAAANPCFSLFNPFSWRAVAKAVQELGPDAVALPHWTAAWTPFEFFLTHQRVPVFGVVHNPFDHSGSPWSRWASWTALRRFRGFLTHAKVVAWQLSRWFPNKPVRVHPLPPPEVTPVARQEARQRLGIPQEAVVFLFFGLIRPYKGLDLLLEAATLLPAEPRWVLAVAGEVWGESERLKTALAHPAVASRVLFNPRWVPEEESAVWFSAADAVVLPYRRATGSAVASQALAYGLPLVASRTGGLEEVVEDGVNGLLVDPGDVAGLARALEAMLVEERRETLAGGARRLGSRWSWDSYTTCLLDLIGEALGRPG